MTNDEDCRIVSKLPSIIDIVYLIAFSMKLNELARKPSSFYNSFEYSVIFYKTQGTISLVILGIVTVFTFMLGIKSGNKNEMIALCIGSIIILWSIIEPVHADWYFWSNWIAILLCLIVVINLAIVINKKATTKNSLSLDEWLKSLDNWFRNKN